jgi:two-component system, NtrC family, nitrogen regulation sensor histidine kinase NtrY
MLKGKVNFFLFLVLVISLAGGMVFGYLSTKPVNQKHLVDQVSSSLALLLIELDAVADRWQQVWSASGISEIQSYHEVDFFVIDGSEIVQWSGNQYLPGVRLALDEFSIRHIKTGAGDFLIRKWKFDNRRALAAIIPLHVHYKIQNEYLEPQWNKRLFNRYEVQVLELSVPQGEEVTANGIPVFRIQSSPVQTSTTDYGIGAVLFVSLFIVCFFVLFFRLTSRFIKQHPGLAFLMLAALLVGFRVLMIVFRFPVEFTHTVVFDPKYFASSDLNPSLGDLVLNSVALALLCLHLFRNYYRFRGLRTVLRPGVIKWLVSVFSVLAILFGVLFPFVVIQTIYNNSAITLNISESVYFDPLRILAFVSIVISWLSSFLFIHVFIRLLTSNKTIQLMAASLVAGGLLFVLINTLTGQLFWSSLITGMGYLVVVILFNLHKSLQRFRYVSFIYFFLAVVAFSLNSLEGLQHFSTARRIQDQNRFAHTFLIDRDDFGEFLLGEVCEKIGNDLFIQNRISGPFSSKDAVRQKVRQIFIPGYFNKYTIEIHLFGLQGDALDDGPALNVDSWIASNRQNWIRTAYDGVYFVNQPDRESARKYFVIIPVKRNELHAGTIVLELSLKRVIPENVYPELLVDNRFQQAYHSQDFSYGVFADHEIRLRSGNFNYRTHADMLNDDRLYNRGVKRDGYLHLGIADAGNSRTIVVSSPAPTATFVLADFSFLLIIGLGAIMIHLLVIGAVDFFHHERLMMSTRIQLILNLSFFIPLIAVSVITLGLTAKSNQAHLNAEYLVKARNFANEFSILSGEQGDPGYAQWFSQLASVSNLDANLFSANGRLLFASQPLIFENQLLSPYINPRAFRRVRNGDMVFIADEQVGKLHYYVAYAALYAPDDGSLRGIAAFPFFQSAYLLEKMQITVLANILSIFTAIFIVLLVISYWVSKWLTFPLQMITQKLGRISLTHSNKPLEWHSEDEIGLMVKEYNQMLSTLSESKKELERTQRERAWREIAQQVAHEIKNPLTPIKLTLQKLERLSENDPQQFKKFQKAVASILTQVDTLDGVASSFSAFAKMPEPVMRETELIGLLKSVITLHKQSAVIHFEAEADRVFIEADEQLLGRIFSNILLNSTQASHHERAVVIRVRVVLKDKNVRITFSDNGTGIDETLQDKIFLPHFSTKKSGSGLGLAIAKQGVEQMGGSIYFESTTGYGTNFYIELPRQVT